MGLTPLEGLVMGTRSGDIDPAIMELSQRKRTSDIDGVMNVLNKNPVLKDYPVYPVISVIWTRLLTKEMKEQNLPLRYSATAQQNISVLISQP